MKNYQRENSIVLRRTRKRLWQKIAMALACVVVVCTVYALILPAITLETDPSVTYSSNLADFTEKYELLDIHGHPITDNKVYIGENYLIKVYFKETNIQGDNKQFKADTSGQLTYQFDSENLSFAATDWTDLMVRNNDTLAIINAGRFKIDSNGKLVVEFYEKNNEDKATPGVVFFDHYTNTDMNIQFTVSVDSSDEGEKLSINLGNSVQIEVDAPKTAAIKAEKTSSSFHEIGHYADYAINVECEHGAVTDFTLTDTPVITDKKTGVEYGIDSGKFTISNVVIKDTFGNIVRDGSGNPVTDISLLPDTLSGGEGYEITYRLTLDRTLYDKYSNYNIQADNSLTASAKDLDGNTITKTDTSKIYCNGSNIVKQGTALGHVTIDGHEYSLTRWSVTVGDYDNVMSAYEIVDTLGQTGQHYYTEEAPTYRIISPSQSTGTLVWGTTALLSSDSSSATFKIPANSGRCEVLYYTYSDPPTTEEGDSKVYTNTALVRKAYGNNDWTATSSVTVTNGVPSAEKEMTGVDDEYLYYRLEIYVPGSQFEKKVFLQDELTGDGSRYYINMPEDVNITLVNRATGEETALTQYSGSGSTKDTFKVWTHGQGPNFADSQSHHFRITFPDDANRNGPYPSSLNGVWPYDYDVTLIVTYKTSRQTPTYKVQNNVLIPGETMDDSLKKSFLVRNIIRVNYNEWDKADDEVSYNEIVPMGKKGSVTDTRNGILSYRVAFSNDTFPAGKYNFRSDKVPLMPSEFTNAYFHDELGEEAEYVEGSLYALIYQRPSDPTKNLTADFGENILPFGVFKYTGDDLTGNEVTAYWEDFTTFNYNGQFTLSKPDWFPYKPATDDIRYTNGVLIEHLHNLAEVMESADNGKYGIVFIYDVKVKDEYRNDLTKTETVLEIGNSADVGWSTPDGIAVSGPAIETVGYNTQLLKKEYTHFDEDDRIHYTITVNEYGYDLTDKEHFTLADNMCEDLSLFLSSVTVEEGTIDAHSGIITWEAYSGDPQISYNPDGNVLTLVVPDDRPIRVSYDCRITKEGSVSLYNTVEITGFTKAINTNNAVFNVSGSGGTSGGGSENWLYVRKNDADTHRALSGATFALYGANSERYSDASVTEAPETITVNGDTLHFYGLYTTTEDSSNPALNGTFALSDLDILETEGHFALKEVKPPEGYNINTNVFDFYWKLAPPGASSQIPVYIEGNTMIIDDVLCQEVLLPETGGIGVITVMTGGAVLIFIGFAYGYSQRRKLKKKKQTV